MAIPRSPLVIAGLHPPGGAAPSTLISHHRVPPADVVLRKAFGTPFATHRPLGQPMMSIAPTGQKANCTQTIPRARAGTP
jgi:hypothetical protein